jgi:hypothetical protein
MSTYTCSGSRGLVSLDLGPVNLPAYMIFLAVQPVLFVFRDMTIMPGSHPSFFFTDPVIPSVQVMRLTPAHVTIFHFIMDAVILIVQAVIHFSAAGMIFCKTAILCHGNIRNTQKSNK